MIAALVWGKATFESTARTIKHKDKWDDGGSKWQRREEWNQQHITLSIYFNLLEINFFHHKFILKDTRSQHTTAQNIL